MIFLFYQISIKKVCSDFLFYQISILSDAPDKEIRTLKTRCNQSRKNIKNKTTKETYRLIKKTVAGKFIVLEHNIKSRHIQKRNRDHVQPTIVTCKGNRFKRNIILNKKKEKHKRYRVRKKENIQQTKQNAPDQNTINLSSAVLSVEKSHC